MKLGIVIFPSKEIQDRANNLRKRYDTNYALIPPHITIKRAFDASETEVTDIAEQLKKIAAGIQPFPIQVTKISTFYPITNVLYLKIEPNSELQTLHDNMYSGYFTQKQEYSFVPHITVAQDLTNQEHADVLGRLKMKQFQYEQTIDLFHLMYQLDDGAWTVYETFHLGKD
ncbi:YjcG family protein [Ectobacillus polymachus]|uniref:YjcG family protein n=1 Tax=Ectobacillus polymachus TaxID=1508806 RepID=UPI003A8A23F7